MGLFVFARLSLWYSLFAHVYVAMAMTQCKLPAAWTP